MKHKQTPLYDRVIVQRLEAEEPPSRIIQSVKKEKPMRAKVIAVGPGRLNRDGDLIRNLTVRPGDTVLIGKYAGVVYEELGDDLKTVEYVILREEDILTVFVPEKGKK